MKYISARSKILAVLSIFFVGIFIGGIAYGAIPHSTSKVITACRNDSNGTLKVINAEIGETCGSSASVLSWDGSQSAIVHIDNDQNAQTFPLSYNPNKSRNILNVTRVYSDGISIPSDGFCIDLSFRPLYGSDRGSSQIEVDFDENGTLEAYCGQSTDYEAFIAAGNSGSWFFSE